MPVLRLKLSASWFNKLKTAAIDSDKDVSQFVLELLAVSCPPPAKHHEVDQEPLVRSVVQMCQALEATKRDLMGALASLKAVTARATNPKIALQRRHSSGRLRKAAKERGLTQEQLAKELGVSRQAVSHVMTCAVSLPPAWLPTLSKVLGDDWMSE